MNKKIYFLGVFVILMALFMPNFVEAAGIIKIESISSGTGDPGTNIDLNITIKNIGYRSSWIRV